MMADETAMGHDGNRTMRWKRWALAVLFLILGAGVVAAMVLSRPLPIDQPPALATLNASANRGEYVAKIGNCAACHSVEGGDAFAGGVRFETPFGVLYSTNITPDRKQGIGEWSFAQFHAAMKHGVRPDGTHLYPAFPYGSFAHMTDEDIASLYLYFSGLEPSAQPNRGNAMAFPFGNRSLLVYWKRLFHPAPPADPASAQSDAAKQGAYLVEAVAHCSACHTPRNILGGLDEDRAMHGGTYVDQVASLAYRKWSAVDLTPGVHGLAKWSEEDIVRYLKEGKNKHAIVHGPMTEVFASTRHLTDRDAAAIAAYLKGLEPSSERFDFSLLKSGISAGETVYTVHCGTCHLPNGRGDRILGVSLRGNPIVQAQDPSSLINVILYGPDLPPPPFVSDRTRMKPFGKRLSDEDIAAVATYLRSRFGNNASAVSAEQVAKQR